MVSIICLSKWRAVLSKNVVDAQVASGLVAL